MVIDSDDTIRYKTDIIHSMLRGTFLAICDVSQSASPYGEAAPPKPYRHGNRLFQRFINLLGSSAVKHRSGLSTPLLF